MLYEVPRLAEEEAKIVGPLNAKQFFILVGVFVIIALTLFITFGKIGNRPITSIITNIIKQIWNPSLYVFRKKEPTIKELYPEITKKIEQESQITTKVARSTKEDIKNLAKQLDKN